jgi:hypothetical protein
MQDFSSFHNQAKFKKNLQFANAYGEITTT